MISGYISDYFTFKSHFNLKTNLAQALFTDLKIIMMALVLLPNYEAITI